jgi:NADH-quinone oxidoreductase subunit L
LLSLQELIAPIAFNIYSILAFAIFLIPIFVFLILLFFGHKLKHADWFATILMFISFFVSFYLFYQVWFLNQEIHARFDWINLTTTYLLNTSSNIKFTLGIHVDKIAALMLVIVTFISALVHLYSQEYMKGDKQYVRYFAYLNTFTASMLGIVLSDNLFSIFIFWELVGLTSYLLIGFYYQKNAAVRASKKAFLINRIGDLGFLIGLMILWSLCGTLDLNALHSLLNGASFSDGNWVVSYYSKDTINSLYIIITNTFPIGWLTVAGIGIFCGCIGKSAQFPLQIWLPDAMEGPTPVSALIHAATMVAAGVFLLARVFFLLDGDSSTFIVIIGCISAFGGAYAAISQYDIKKILAYSTISQLGYMVMGMGASAYRASLFHLITHAFFKAGLFLCAGAVIHAMHHVKLQLEKQGTVLDFDTQNVNLMGGLKKVMPKTFILYVILSWAAMGLPLSSGFLSKDSLLVSIWAWAEVKSLYGNSFYYIIPIVAYITAFITAFYMGRQMFIVFTGELKLDKIYSEAKGAIKHIHDPGLKMLIPLTMLALLSIGFVFSINPFSVEDTWVMKFLEEETKFSSINIGVYYEELYPVIEKHHFSAMIISIIVSFSGLFLSYIKYGKKESIMNASLSPNSSRVAAKLSRNNFYLDYFYQRVGVRIVVNIANVFAWFDKNIIDKLVNYFGVLNVVIAHMIAWFDLNIIDGVVHLFVYIAQKVGGLTRSFQSGKIQSYFAFVITAILLFFTFLLFN